MYLTTENVWVIILLPLELTLNYACQYKNLLIAHLILGISLLILLSLVESDVLCKTRMDMEHHLSSLFLDSKIVWVPSPLEVLPNGVYQKINLNYVCNPPGKVWWKHGKKKTMPCVSVDHMKAHLRKMGNLLKNHLKSHQKNHQRSLQKNLQKKAMHLKSLGTDSMLQDSMLCHLHI